LAGSTRSERFLTWPMAVALAVYALFAVTFSAFQVKGDALVYFNLMRRFFGEDPDFAFAYQFGSDVWNTPFFLVGKLLQELFGYPKTFHVSFEELSITAATEVGFVVTLYLGWRLLRDLDLPNGPAVLFLTAFGTPLFYYVVFEPAMKHAADTLAMTAAVLFLLRIYTRRLDRDAVLLGAIVGVSVNIRHVNVVFFLAVACALALARPRAAALGAATAAIVGPVIFALPALRGISYFVPTYFPEPSAVARVALGAPSLVADVTNPVNGFDPLTPLKMLVSDHRGLFVWTPLTAAAVVGFGLLLWRTRDSERRAFIWALTAGSLALLAAHSIWGFWDGAFSFSSRFLTALFPVFLIGVAELRRRIGPLVYVPLTACVAWSLMLALVHVVGYDGITAGDGAGKTVRVIDRTHDDLQDKIQTKATDRWEYLWALLHGEDPKHVNGP
jgi:hypothetical protein